MIAFNCRIAYVCVDTRLGDTVCFFRVHVCLCFIKCAARCIVACAVRAVQLLIKNKKIQTLAQSPFKWQPLNRAKKGPVASNVFLFYSVMFFLSSTLSQCGFISKLVHHISSVAALYTDFLQSQLTHLHNFPNATFSTSLFVSSLLPSRSRCLPSHPNPVGPLCLVPLLLPPGPRRDQLHHPAEPDQHGARGGPPAGHRLRGAGAGAHRGRLWQIQQQDVLPNPHRW